MSKVVCCSRRRESGTFGVVKALQFGILSAWLTAATGAGCGPRTPPESTGLAAEAPTGTTSASTPTPAEVERAAARASAATGRPAPDFALPDDADRPVRLADFRGRWVVLYFYPHDDTPGCTCQATEFTTLLGEFRDLNAAVVGVSTDSPANHRYFRQKYALTMTLLSDPDATALRAYGAWVDTPAAGPGTGRTVRQTYLIDPNGTIARHWPEVIPDGHAERVRQALAELAGPATRPAAARADG